MIDARNNAVHPIPTAARTLRFARSLFAAAAVAAAGYAWSAAKATPDIALADLPKEARELYVLIGKGGPFRYDRDGVVFGNREKRLPMKPHGYYHEYTVRTPGVGDRGARRMVCGGPKTAPVACYYSGDHYQSFRRIHP